MNLCSMLDVNYKTALLLKTKCRILMSSSNSEKILDSLFYKADIFNIGATSKSKVVHATEQQLILSILSIDKKNKYPRYIILRLIKDYSGLLLKKILCFIRQHILNTDGEYAFNILNTQI